MGAQLAGKGGGGRGKRRSYRAMAEINMTPFIDVMLVLLIVFMQEQRVDRAGLVPLLSAITNANAEARILVRGDARIAYGTMLEVMGTMSAAGCKKVGLVAELPNTPAKR